MHVQIISNLNKNCLSNLIGTVIIGGGESSDTLLVQINPIEREGTPRTARDILNPLNEVAFP